MAFAIANHYPGGTREHYEFAVGKVHPPDGGLPQGQLHHYAGPTGSGWMVTAVWDSRESWERFRDETLMPALEEMGDRGFPSPPDITEFEVAKEQHRETVHH